MKHDYDVIIVGAGFAGATAARECATRGLRTLVLEGRDRIGGRSGSRRLSDGSYADVGGTFVHWTQPHTWSEITRYGLTDDVIPGVADLEWTAIYADGEVTWIPYKSGETLTRAAYDKIQGASAEVFPNPTQPLLALAEVSAMDAISTTEALQRLGLSEYEYASLSRTFAGFSGRALDDTSWLTLLRWLALGNDNYADFTDMEMGWKLKNGTGSLIDAIISDGGAEVRLNTPVAGIDSSDDGVRVTLKDGGEVGGRACIIATPANVWPHLDLDPALPEQQAAAAAEGMAVPASGKCVAVLKGETRAMQFVGDETAPMSFLTTDFRAPDEQVVAVYPFPGSDFDVSDPTLIKTAIEKALPHVTVLESVGDMYRADDPMFHGAYGFLRPGQLTKYVPHENFTRLDERVVFATSDIARFFHGAFFDGAIESGLRAAREIRAYLDAQ
ncbi:FAD-dependent oxidoreductase [Dietzia sp. DQ11-71]|nr:NAD(P)/FAD-dependent oxidoreductase [Dietzia sp. DQ11-71]MBB1016757.1 FAD-dependent oxidoreductase [Dietzia sp. DQ11-71]